MIKPQRKSKIVTMIAAIFTGILIFTCFTTACHPKGAVEKQEENVILNKAEESINPTEKPDSTITNTAEGNSEDIDDNIEAVKKFDYLMQSDIETVKLGQTEDFFGDKLKFYYCNNGKSGYRILASDNSLVAFSSKEVDLSITMQISDDELIEIALDYAKRVWGYDNVLVTSQEVNISELSSTEKTYFFDVKGVMGQDKRPFSVALNGKGVVWGQCH